jgi:hypothetical protein
MWAVTNRTPYAADRNWTRDKAGVHFWIVAVKATYAIGDDGALALADEQLPPVLGPVHHGEPGLSSLKYDSDLLAIKPGTDVIVNGSAHAPGGKPAPAVDVTLKVDKIQKTIRVSGLRVYAVTLGMLRATSPQPFTSRPILYEWAYGGFDTSDPDPSRHRMEARNPIGKGFATRDAHLDGQPAPSIEYPSGDPAKKGPAGFGAIDRAWSPRREFAGTYDEKWAETKKPLLPDDYDERFALCAPLDQRPAEPLRGGEAVELVNLTPEGVLRFQLPKHYFTFTTRFGSRREEHRAKLVSVVIEPDDRRLMMAWQTALKVRARDPEHLDETIVFEKPYLS